MHQDIANFSEEFSSKIPALTLLTNLGYQFLSIEQCNKMRTSKTQVLLTTVLRQVLQQKSFSFKNKTYPLSADNIDKIINDITSTAINLSLQQANEKIYNQLIYGVDVTEFIDGSKSNQTISLIDWQNPENNKFHYTEEFAVENTNATDIAIPDIVCFVNGLPLVVIEAKKPIAKKAGKPPYAAAISQCIRNQSKNKIPHLFAYSQILLAIDGNSGKYATCGTPLEFWSIWREQQFTATEFTHIKTRKLNNKQIDAIFNSKNNNIKAEYLKLISSGELTLTGQDQLLISLLKPERLLKITRLFILFDNNKGKIIARYHQFFGVQQTIERINSSENSTPKRQGGVIWHTTGSGKSLTMVFLVNVLVYIKQLAQCKIIVVTDRIDLENQLFKTFKATDAISSKRSNDAKANTGKCLAKKISTGNERIVFTIINKFASAVKQLECKNSSPNIIVLVDEGHRSQYGETNIQMQCALPNAAFLAFTGTPLLKHAKTENKFGKIIHSYTMQQATADGIVAPLLYENRLAKLDIDEATIDKYFERFTENFSEKQKTKLKKKFIEGGEINKLESRLELIAYDISDHFPQFKAKNLKAQLACDSKIMAIRYKKILDKIGKVTSRVVISAPDTREGHDIVDQTSKCEVQQWWQENIGKQNESKYTKESIAKFSKAEEPDILIVVDKLLTGFDEPKNTVLYIDKPLKQHSLIQAIARVNRLHKAKKHGYLIDYRSVLAELDMTIKKYRNLAIKNQQGYDIADITGLYSHMETEYKNLPQLYTDLWAAFADVTNKQDGAALRQLLMPKFNADKPNVDINTTKRNNFYLKLTAFSNCLKIALQSKSYFEDVSFDEKRQHYKQTLKTMFELRQQVADDACETIDIDDSLQDLTVIINKHVTAVAIEPGVKCSVDELTNIPAENLTDNAATVKAAKIQKQITLTVTNDLIDDPYAKKKLSELINQEIAKINTKAISLQAKCKLLENLQKQVEQRYLENIPYAISNHADKNFRQRTQAYYGIFLLILGEDLIINNDNKLSEQQAVDYVVKIDKIIEPAIAENSLHRENIANCIKLELLPLLFTEIKLAMPQAEKVIAEIIQSINYRLTT